MSRIDENLEASLGNDIFSKLLRMIYSSDGGDIAHNLFPSYHCLLSLYCYLGIWRSKEISKWFKIYSIVEVIVICLSTVFTKQHYVLDVFGGLSIALISYLLIEFINPGEKIVKKRSKQLDKN